MIAIASAHDSEPAAGEPFAPRPHRSPTPSRNAAAVALATFIDELGGSANAVRTRRIAAGHLERFLGRPPVIADLAGEPITALLEALKVDGRHEDTTRARIREDLRRLGRLAAERGLLEYEPFVDAVPHSRERKSLPWTIAELNRMLGSARTMPDTVAGLPAGHWWPAILLLLLDTAEPAAAALAAPSDAYDRHAGTVALGSLIYSLHPHTVEALEAITVGAARDRLFPWTLDGGRPPYFMLYRQYRWLLWRADLPHVTRNMFCRLQQTARRQPGIVGRVDPRQPFRPREGKPKLPRATDRRRALARAEGELPPNRRLDGSEAGPPPVANSKPQIYFIRALNPDRALLHFFEESYRPIRLAGRAAVTAKGYRGVIANFQTYLGCEPTIDHLTENLIESFMAWTLKSGRAIATANGRAAHLVALANFAWKKRKTDYRIREVERITPSKRLPDAWSLEELGLLLRTAEAQPGSMGGIPAATWWPMLLLTLYESALRLSAALSLRSADFRPPFILARAETQKQDSDQLFKLHPETVSLLSSTNPADRELLFPRDKGRLHNRLRAILQAAGLPHGRRDLFHKIRRTSATFLARVAGKAAAQEHLGHSSPTVTALYLDRRLLDADRVDAGDLLPRPSWLPPAAK